jgi:arsenate reductase-like glutaredoxin family protein
MSFNQRETEEQKRRRRNQSQGIKLAIRQAGEGGITRQELNNITKSTGANAQTVIRRLDQVNQKLNENDSARIGLNSGAANMLIKRDSKNPVGMFSQGRNYGTGAIGKTLSSMMGTPGIPGAMIKGQMVGGRAAQPGFNPGGNPTKNRMIGGTQIRGGGNIAVRGFGQQYTAPTQPVAEPVPSSVTPEAEAPVVEEPMPMTPEQMDEASAAGPGMTIGGGTGAAGATKLGRAKSRLRKLGIYGRGTGLLGRGLQYGNTLNA